MMNHILNNMFHAHERAHTQTNADQKKSLSFYKVQALD